jgi:hypothetical protein
MASICDEARSKEGDSKNNGKAKEARFREPLSGLMMGI